MDDKDRKIRVGVFANPLRDEGASIRTKDVPFIMRYEVPPGISDNMFSYSVCRTERYTLFMMYCNSKNIRTMDGEDGILNIGVSIEAQYALDKGKSVYDLLQAVFSQVKNAYLSETSDVHGRARFKFNRTMDLLPQSYFDDVLADYSVTKSRYVYNPMTGSSSAGIELSEERIRALFGNVDYYISRHFLGYSEVIVAPKLNSYFSGKIMPLPKRRVTLVPAVANSYGIIAYYYDENNDKQYLSDVAGNSEVIVEEPDFDRNIIVTSNRNERCYERGPVSFTVNNVLASIGTNVELAGVYYDPMVEKIACSPKDIEKAETIAIDLQTPESLESIRHSIRLTLDGRDLAVDSDGRFALKGMQIDAARQPDNLKVSCNHIRYDINGNPFLSDGFYHVSLKYKTSNSMQSTSSVSEPQGNGKIKTDLQLKIQGHKFGKGDIVVAASCGKQSVSKMVSELPENRIVVLSLLPDFVGPDKKITISVSCGSEKWEKTYKAKDFINQPVKFNVSEAKSVAVKRSKGGVILGKIIFWSAPILLILLLATGVFAFLQWKEKGKLKDSIREYEAKIEHYESEMKEQTVLSKNEQRLEEPPVPAVTVKTLTDEQKRTFDNALRELTKEKLTFETVNTLYKTYSELDDELKTQVDKTYRQAVDKIKAYHNVVDILQNGNADDIKKLDVDNENMKLLNEYHRNLVLAIYYGDYNKDPQKPNKYAESNRVEKKNGEETTYFGKEGGLNFFLEKRDEARYKSFKDMGHMLTTRNYGQQGER